LLAGRLSMRNPHPARSTDLRGRRAEPHRGGGSTPRGPWLQASRARCECRASLAAEAGGRAPRDADVGELVVHTPREAVDWRGLVQAGEPALVPLAVRADVLLVRLLQRQDRAAHLLVAALLAHLLGREARVTARSVPVPRNRLGVKRHNAPKVLGNAAEHVPARCRQPGDVGHRAGEQSGKGWVQRTLRW